ncbi:glycine cleavage system aminomethyltransferase GcvT [Kushneria phosphatilytica]|uniref:aminomethyltransferase n=1 Tax=Kushneria phosphatilytica TaxID=657387 RepID=A0A1S1NX74_9GAMM|nr:glycine cleavage system aminomethyltransferase GcvT [Kushneria phosphatilytica]OHV11976.1 glycine cleavage system protein T [Kushneria phosphatilytica]QEL11161.1 glycine cleavage system aminomethyltransferase GcvT [Kushneria phosphatilytica]
MSDDLLHTSLYDLHQRSGAKFVPFAGYAMPVQFAMGVKREHEHVRQRCGLFDVSHMGQILLHGNQAAMALEQIAPIDAQGLKTGRQRYGLFTNNNGGVHDDFMAVNAGDHFYLVVNAARRSADLVLLQTGLGEDVEIEVLEDRALLALQGPEARTVLSELCPEVGEMIFMDHRRVEIEGVPTWVSCSGYTGEDGYELSVPKEQAETLAQRLLSFESVEPIGLGARDSLRLEAGLCLYGHDLDETTTPADANLGWAIGKARRQGGEREGGFPGADVILTQLANRDSPRLRVGLQGETRTPVREGTLLYDEADVEIGQVTSGTFGPSVGAPIAMAYLERAWTERNQTVYAEVRGKRQPMQVSAMPFIKPRYYRG